MPTLSDHPPEPRRLPQQERSHKMVCAILDACLKILQEYGESALSITLLEAVSGVSKGSIYQYFQNLDSIIGALYERELEIFHDGKLKDLRRHHCATLKGEIQFMTESAIEWHDKMAGMHSSFHSRYCLHYDVCRRFINSARDFDVARDHFAPLILREHSGSFIASPIETAHLLLQTFNNLFFSTLRYYPQRIHEPEFHLQLLNTCLALVENAPRNRRIKFSPKAVTLHPVTHNEPFSEMVTLENSLSFHIA